MEYSNSTSEFSGDLDLLGRINKIKTLMQIAILTNNVRLRFDTLKTFFFELVPEIKDEKTRTETYNKLQRLATEIYYYESTINNTKLRKPNNTLPPELIMHLDMYQMELEALFERSGLRKRISKDSRHAIG